MNGPTIHSPESQYYHYTIVAYCFPHHFFTKGLHSTGIAKGCAFPSLGNFKKYENYNLK